MNIAVVGGGVRCRILDINDTLLTKLGFEREKVIGRYCYEILHPFFHYFKSC